MFRSLASCKVQEICANSSSHEGLLSNLVLHNAVTLGRITWGVAGIDSGGRLVGNLGGGWTAEKVPK